MDRESIEKRMASECNDANDAEYQYELWSEIHENSLSHEIYCLAEDCAAIWHARWMELDPNAKREEDDSDE